MDKNRSRLQSIHPLKANIFLVAKLFWCRSGQVPLLTFVGWNLFCVGGATRTLRRQANRRSITVIIPMFPAFGYRENIKLGFRYFMRALVTSDVTIISFRS